MSGQRFRRGQKLGKYKLLERLGAGGFAVVYRARDTVEGRDVALKLPVATYGSESHEELLREVRLTLSLVHPNIVPVLNADIVGEQLVIATQLGRESLSSRLHRRMSDKKALSIVTQVLEALAFAHGERVIHCDVNPSNVILFQHDHVALADFGLARVAAKTQLLGSGSGTVGYIAPEQAMGHPSFRSDVFAWGLLTYRLFAGQLPRWPYRPPLPGWDRIRQKLTRPAQTFLKRAIEPEYRKRFRNAVQLQEAFEAIPEFLR
ncbi:MAG: serine/threonine-protein kinase [Sandaracinaceae bacterium]